jgi:hypothetical protein
MPVGNSRCQFCSSWGSICQFILPPASTAAARQQADTSSERSVFKQSIPAQRSQLQSADAATAAVTVLQQQQLAALS